MKSRAVKNDKSKKERGKDYLYRRKLFKSKLHEYGSKTSENTGNTKCNNSFERSRFHEEIITESLLS